MSLVFGEHESFNINSFIVNTLPADYYIILYSVLYIVSPYINMVIEKLDKNQFKRMLTIFFIIFSVYSYLIDYLNIYFDVSPALSPVTMDGSRAGYTIVNFVFLYIIGGYIGKYGLDISTKKSVIILFLVFFVDFFFSLHTDSAWNYDNPLIIIISIFVFYFFSKVSIKSKVINELSKSSFTTYILHKKIVGFLISYTEKYINSPLIIVMLNYLVISISIFAISYIVWKAYSVIEKILFNKLYKKMDEIDI